MSPRVMQTFRVSRKRGMGRFADKFFGHDHPGALIVGRPRSGKTVTAQSLLIEGLRMGQGLTCMTPHHDIYLAVKNFVMSQPEKLRDKLIDLCPAEGRYQAVNPLHIAWPSEIPGRVDQTRRILKSSYAMSNNKDVALTDPAIDEWMDAALEATALLRLPLAVAPDFLDVYVAHHFHLLQLLGTVKPELAQKLASISAMRPLERTQLVGPALRRLHDVIRKTPRVRDLLSLGGTIDARDWIAGKRAALISLKPTSAEGVELLRPMDVRLLANLFIVPLYNAARSFFGQEQPVPHCVCIDEFQTVAEALGPEMRHALAELSKVGFKQIAITQSASNFSRGIEDETLQAFQANAGYLLNFNLQSDVDTEFFSKPMYTYNYRPRIKHVLKQKIQEVVGFDVISLVNSAYTWMLSSGAGGSRGQGYDRGRSGSMDRSFTETDQTQQALAIGKGLRRGTSNATHDGRSDYSSNSMSRVDGNPRQHHSGGMGSGESHATTSSNSQDVTDNVTDTESNSTALARGQRAGAGWDEKWNLSVLDSWQTQRQQGGGITINQQTVPRYSYREIVAAVQFLNESEQGLWWRQIHMLLLPGQCIAHIAGCGTAHLVFEMPVDYGKRYARRIATNTVAFLEQLSRRDNYVEAAAIEGLYERLIAGILEDHGQLDLPPIPQKKLLLPGWIAFDRPSNYTPDDYPYDT